MARFENDQASVPHDRSSGVFPVSGDTLSEVLRVVRLTGAVFFTVDGSAPWAAEAPAAREIGPYIMPGVEHAIEYHLVAAGSCYGGIVGEDPVKLEAGDVIVFPQGHGHVMSSAPGMRAPPNQELMRNARSNRLPIAITKNGGGAEGAKLICGFLGCDARPFNPLLAALPKVIHLERRALEGGAVEHL